MKPGLKYIKSADGHIYGYDEIGTIIDDYEGDGWLGVDEDTRLVDPQDDEDRRKIKEFLLLQANLKAQLPDSAFVFVHCEELGALRPETAARIVMLGTYLPWCERYSDGGMALKRTQRSPVRREDLPDILRVTRRTVDGMIEDAAGILTIGDDGVVFLDKAVVYCGRLAKKTPFYRRVWVSPIRSIWQKISPSQQRYLGYLFQMLPFLSVDHNYLCREPQDIEVDDAEAMSVQQFADCIGYDNTNAARLKNAYRAIQFSANGSQEAFCAFVGRGKRSRIIVNPAVVYSGKDPESVRIQREICRQACSRDLCVSRHFLPEEAVPKTDSDYDVFLNLP